MYVRGAWYGDQECSVAIWNNVISDGVRRCAESDKCAMGARSVL
jgi:hypothetical protein